MTPMKTDAGCFLAYAWPGGYPLFYLNEGNETVCPLCANHETTIVACDVNWEDPMLWCAGCNQRIESAYAEDGHPDRT